MNGNYSAKFVVRSVVSIILLVALIVGIVVLGNVMQNKNDNSHDRINNWQNGGTNNNSHGNSNNNSQGNSNDVTSEDMGGGYNEKFTLYSDADTYNFKISVGDVKISTTTEIPYILVTSDHLIHVSSTYSNSEYNFRFKPDNDQGNWFGNRLFDDFVPKIEIFLPENKPLKKLGVDLLAGVVSINDIVGNTFDVDVNAGELIVENCDFQELDSSVSAGSFTFYATDSIRKIESEVNAGEANLYLPSDISGFSINYDVSAGSINNNTSFSIGDIGSGLNRKGSVNFGDGSRILELDVTAGAINLEDY